jgi:hypothetical protein
MCSDIAGVLSRDNPVKVGLTVQGADSTTQAARLRQGQAWAGCQCVVGTLKHFHMSCSHLNSR